MKNWIHGIVAAALCCVVATFTFAAIIVDDEGVGFVGKGDVQTLFGWNNHDLQACTSSDPQLPGDAGCLRFEFFVEAVDVTEVSWICTNSNNENTQERARTTTSTTNYGGITATEARKGKQTTGFNLNGGEFAPSEAVVKTEGNPLNSCPNGPWELTTPAGDPEVIESFSLTSLRITDTRSGVSHIVDLVEME